MNLEWQPVLKLPTPRSETIHPPKIMHYFFQEDLNTLLPTNPLNRH